MSKRAVFFDLGGTLLVMRRDRIFERMLSEAGYTASLKTVHDAYVSLDAWWLAAHAEGARMSPEESQAAYSDLHTNVFQTVLPAAGPEEARNFARIAQARWSEIQSTVPLELYPDSEPLLAALKKDGHKMALVSNAPPDTEAVVTELGLRKYMDVVVISSTVGYAKPHPEIFRIALRRAGTAAEQTLHVGDLYESDVVGARNSGIDPVLLDRDGSKPAVDCPRIGGLSEVYNFL